MLSLRLDSFLFEELNKRSRYAWKYNRRKPHRKGLRDSKRFLALLPFIGLIVSLLLLWLCLSLSNFITSEQSNRATNCINDSTKCTIIYPQILQCCTNCRCILRSGGDTNYACLLDVLPIWLFSIPIGYALVTLQAPAWLIFLVINGGYSQAYLGYPHVFSGKWLQ